MGDLLSGAFPKQDLKLKKYKIIATKSHERQK